MFSDVILLEYCAKPIPAYKLQTFYANNQSFNLSITENGKSKTDAWIYTWFCREILLKLCFF